MAGNKGIGLLFVMAACAACADSRTPGELLSHGPAYGKEIAYSQVQGSAGAIAVELDGGKLYALSGGGLNIYALDDPMTPRLLGSVDGLGNVRQLAVRGDTAYVTARQDGLWVVDVANPREPKVLSRFDTIELATGLDVVGDVAFVGLRVYGVQAVDVSDRRAPRHLSSYKTSESQSVFYHDRRLYSGDWALGEITVFDASDVRNLKVLSVAKLDGYGDGLCVSGNTLFAATGHHAKSGPEELREGAGHGLEIFDVSDPAAPKKRSVTKFPKFFTHANDFWTPRVSGSFCFVADTANGVFLLDVSNLDKPTFAGQLRLPVPKGGTLPDAVGGIAVGEGVLYIAGVRTGLYAARLEGVARSVARDAGRPPERPADWDGLGEKNFISAGASRRAPVRALALKGDLAYAACSTDGLKVFRLADDAVSEVMCVQAGDVCDVKIRGDYLYLALGMKGLAAYRIRAPGELEEDGRLDFDGAQFLWAPDGTHLVMSTRCDSSVCFTDFSDPAKPKSVWKHTGKQLLYGNYAAAQLVRGRYFACPRHCGGFTLFDLSGAAPRLAAYDPFPLCSQAGGAAAFRDRFLVMRNGGYALVDPDRLTPIQEWARKPFPGAEAKALPADAGDSPAARAMFPQSEYEGLPVVAGNLVAVSNRLFKRCCVYDFSDPDAPALLRAYAFKEHPNAPSFWNGRLVFPAGYAGVLLERKVK